MASRRRITPRWARVLLVVGLVVAVLAGAATVSAHLLIDRWERAVGQADLLGPAAGSRDAPGGRPDSDQVTGPLNYLVIGTDQRPDQPEQVGLADAIVIVHIPEGLREAYVISVPRDLRVAIPGHGIDKINSAYRLGGGGSEGVSLLADTLTELAGVRFDGAAILDFRGFEEVVDALGGVEICLDAPVDSIHTGAHFPARCQQLSGAEALDLARQRYDLPAGDLDRGRHHQQLIQAMVDQARSMGMLTDPLRLDRTIQAAGAAVTVDTGGVPPAELAFALRGLRPEQMTGITLPSYPQQIDGTSYVIADPAADGLYQALRTSTLEQWVAGHPRWRNE